mgnify:CR=1 FL=1
MVENERAANAVSTPSPGQVLSRSRRESAGERSPVEFPDNPFRTGGLAQACQDRGVMLAPVLVVWHYRVVAAKPFARWLATKDIVLSDARFGLQRDTVGTHYFGTYILQQPQPENTDLDQ